MYEHHVYVCVWYTYTYIYVVRKDWWISVDWNGQNFGWCISDSQQQTPDLSIWGSILYLLAVTWKWKFNYETKNLLLFVKWVWPFVVHAKFIFLSAEKYICHRNQFCILELHCNWASVVLKISGIFFPSLTNEAASWLRHIIWGCIVLVVPDLRSRRTFCTVLTYQCTWT